MATAKHLGQDAAGSGRAGGRLRYSVAETAAMLGVSPNTIYIMLSRGQIKGRKMGRRVWFLPDEIAAWLRGTGVK